MEMCSNSPSSCRRSSGRLPRHRLRLRRQRVGPAGHRPRPALERRTAAGGGAEGGRGAGGGWLWVSRGRAVKFPWNSHEISIITMKFPWKSHEIEITIWAGWNHVEADETAHRRWPSVNHPFAWYRELSHWTVQKPCLIAQEYGDCAIQKMGIFWWISNPLWLKLWGKATGKIWHFAMENHVIFKNGKSSEYIRFIFHSVILNYRRVILSEVIGYHVGGINACVVLCIFLFGGYIPM